LNGIAGNSGTVKTSEYYPALCVARRKSTRFDLKTRQIKTSRFYIKRNIEDTRQGRPNELTTGVEAAQLRPSWCVQSTIAAICSGNSSMSQEVAEHGDKEGRAR
jgi:hypothetical protein